MSVLRRPSESLRATQPPHLDVRHRSRRCGHRRARAPVRRHRCRTPAATSDFNGDGYADLAVGVPDGTVAGQAKAGYVNVVWGGPSGVGAHGSIRVSQATAEVPGSPEAGDRFGASVALVDLNGDSVAELLAGAPGEDVTDRGTDAGMVIAVGGSEDGPGPGSTVLTGPSPSAAYGRSVTAAHLTGGDNKTIVIGGTDKVVARVIQGEDSLVTTVVAAPMGGRAPSLPPATSTATARRTWPWRTGPRATPTRSPTYACGSGTPTGARWRTSGTRTTPV